jgi:hypothetical protein
VHITVTALADLPTETRWTVAIAMVVLIGCWATLRYWLTVRDYRKLVTTGVVISITKPQAMAVLDMVAHKARVEYSLAIRAAQAVEAAPEDEINAALVREMLPFSIVVVIEEEPENPDE